MTISPVAYLNGRFVAASEASISPFDRGFLFAHAAYEVTAVYGGELIDADRHIGRLGRTLEGLDIPNPMSREAWIEVHTSLIDRNHLTEGLIYLQVTGGDYGDRDFAGPKDLIPSIFMFCVARDLVATEAARDGIKAVTLPDTRWTRRDLKTTQLLSQALAYRRARDEGATTAIMHEEGFVTEAASANVWIVDDTGNLLTRDLSRAILPGITRRAVMDLMASAGRTVIETKSSLETLFAAREIFTSSAGAMIAPVVEIDGLKIGDGHPGPITREVQRLYYGHLGADLRLIPWL